jgi:hypothetical protein
MGTCCSKLDEPPLVVPTVTSQQERVLLNAPLVRSRAVVHDVGAPSGAPSQRNRSRPRPESPRIEEVHSSQLTRRHAMSSPVQRRFEKNSEDTRFRAKSSNTPSRGVRAESVAPSSWNPHLPMSAGERNGGFSAQLADNDKSTQGCPADDRR